MNAKTVKYLGLAALLGLALGAGKAWAASPGDGTITVTPVVGVSLSLDATTYAFGNIDVNTSTNSATELTLTNAGNVDVKVNKKITDAGGWTADVAKGADTFVLYCATAAARVALSGFGANTKFTMADTNLTNAAGDSTPVIAVAGNVKLWFQLDMPSSVSSQVARTIAVLFTAVAQ